MAGGTERILRRRIKSVQSTKKITKAMELIAASRIVKAQQRVNAARPYSEQITEVIRNLAAAGAGCASPLLSSPRRDRHGRLRGHRRRPRPVRWLQHQRHPRRRAGDGGAAGRGQADPPRHRRQEGHRLLPLPRLRDRRRLHRLLRRADLRGRPQGRRGRRRAASRPASTTRSSSSTPSSSPPASQQVVAAPLRAARDRRPRGRRRASGPTADYEFEPEPGEILDRLLPRYAEARLYAALLEGSASFFAAQQRAMKSATDNAEELITKLSRVMNRARQDSITTEIMEIVGGAEALRAGQSGGADLLADNALDVGDVAARHGHHHDRRSPALIREITDDRHRDRHPTLKDGRVVAIAGPVIDVEFPPDAVPQINTACSTSTSPIDGKPQRGAGRGRPADRRQPRAGHLPQARPTASSAAPRCATPATACRCRSATPCSATWST